MCALKKRLTITTTPRQTCDSSKTNRTHRVMRSDNSITFGALIMTGGREWRGAIISQPLLFLSIVHCAPRSSVLCVNSSNRPKEREREEHRINTSRHEKQARETNKTTLLLPVLIHFSYPEKFYPHSGIRVPEIHFNIRS